ncbi:MAG: ATP-binding protein [Erysipelotrichaceae bacterium]|nr:ATP-binding protein [Erysipelotrichaceae bacterium]
MYIKRHMESVIEECVEQFPVVLVTGPRQIGKTTLLQYVCKDFNYITFDDPIILTEAVEETNLFLKNNEPPLIIDEVQYAPQIFRYLKMHVDKEKKKGTFALTGSQAFELMKGVSETLAGRMAIIELEGLSLREIHKVSFNKPFIPNEEYVNERKKELVDYSRLWETIHRGSMPELQDENMNWERYYSSYVKTYIEKDVRQIINISDELKFIKFLTALAVRCGELLNVNSIANEVEVSADTIKRWLSILQTSGIIYLLEPYSNNILKRVVKTPKVYFYDSGLVCYLARWTSAETTRAGAQAGNIYENFIVSEILKSHLNAGKTISSIYFYRDRDQREIDVVIEEDGKLYPIEIKMTGNPTKAMGKHFTALDNIPNKERQPGIILCQYDKKIYLSENVIALPIEYI